MSKPIIVALVGPTGVGKTKTSLFLAKKLKGEIVSMDSMQIYRNMDIGTAKSTPEERAAVSHHMIDVADPHDRFTTADYQTMAVQAIRNILDRGKLPLLVGGTGLYLDAIRYDMRLGESKANEEIREKLRSIAQQPDGQNILHAMLEKVDPETAAKLHPNDIRRVMRALEIFEISGKTKSQQAEAEKREGMFHALVYGLSLPREMMYARINARVDEMMQAGLVEEVKNLLALGVEPNQEGGAMQAIGYKEIVSALRGEITLDRAVELIKQNSRRYAKRQWTWFRHDSSMRWFDYTEYPDREALEQALLHQIEEDIKQYQEFQEICETDQQSNGKR